MASQLPAEEALLLCHHLAGVLAQHGQHVTEAAMDSTGTLRALEGVACLAAMDGVVPEAIHATAKRCAAAIGAPPPSLISTAKALLGRCITWVACSHQDPQRC